MDWLRFLERISNPYLAPDAFSWSKLNIDAVYGGGTDSSPLHSSLYILSGKDAGSETEYVDYSFAVGFDVGASTVVTKYYYTGDVSQLTMSDFQGLRWSGSIGFSAVAELGIGVSVAPVDRGGWIIGVSNHVGVSPPGVSGNVNGGWTIFPDNPDFLK